MAYKEEIKRNIEERPSFRSRAAGAAEGKQAGATAEHAQAKRWACDIAEMVLEVENQLMVEASPFECKEEKDMANLSFYYTGVSMMAVALMRKLGE